MIGTTVRGRRGTQFEGLTGRILAGPDENAWRQPCWRINWDHGPAWNASTFGRAGSRGFAVRVGDQELTAGVPLTMVVRTIDVERDFS